MVYQAPILEVTLLSKQFGGLKAVDGVSWSIRPGEIVALIGPNGAGKTTVFNLLTGFLKPDHGTVVLEGEDITGRPAHTFASRGLVRSFQTAKMFPSMTVAEIVTTAGLLHGSPRTMRAKTDEILERLNLSGKRNTNASELSLPDRQIYSKPCERCHSRPTVMIQWNADGSQDVVWPEDFVSGPPKLP